MLSVDPTGSNGPKEDSGPAGCAGDSFAVPILLLIGALVWIALVRVPLVLNAEAHLDSDLAVDGLTLAEAVCGRWRWHYPGTPHIGIIPVLFSWPQALLWGANPTTLVSGGLVAYELAVIAVFVLAWRGFGPRVAAWSLLPLAFASTGTVWLSGRITGGHLAALVWHAAALALLVGWLRRGGSLRAALLGVWCGLGLYIEAMAIFTVAAVLIGAALGRNRSWPLGTTASCFVLGLSIGMLPRLAGAWADPHDAYREQLVTIFHPINPRDGPIAWEQARALTVEHGRLLALDCLPRLIVGHRLPGLESDPPPEQLTGRRPPRPGPFRQASALATTLLGLPLFVLALAELAARLRPRSPRISAAVAGAVLGSSALIFVAFVVNRNIFNSDNYRYLVLLLVPWSLGVGLFCASRGWPGRVLVLAFTAATAGDTLSWYAGFGWVEGVTPVRRVVRDPALMWLRAHPEVTGIQGAYWDVYRLVFLSDRPCRAVPLAGEPDRFPEWSRPGRPRTEIVRPFGPGRNRIETARTAGAAELYRAPELVILEWPEQSESAALE